VIFHGYFLIKFILIKCQSESLYAQYFSFVNKNAGFYFSALNKSIGAGNMCRTGGDDFDG